MSFNLESDPKGRRVEMEIEVRTLKTGRPGRGKMHILSHSSCASQASAGYAYSQAHLEGIWLRGTCLWSPE